MLAHSRDPSHSARVQLYLDDEGNVDVETTKAEAARVDAARMQSATQTRQKVGVRRRRTQAQQGVDPGLMDMLVRQTEALELAEMGGSWVFSNCIDCKIGKCPRAPLSDSLLNVEQPPLRPLPNPIVALTSTVTGTRILSMYYRKRSEFGLRRSFFAADGPSSSIIVLNQNLESAVPPPHLPHPACSRVPLTHRPPQCFTPCRPSCLTPQLGTFGSE